MLVALLVHDLFRLIGILRYMENIYLQGHQYETVSGFVCESFGYIPEEGAKMLVILEKDYSEEIEDEGSERQDDREKPQAYELEVTVTICCLLPSC
jgi:CBS domain containing-hemolysin-like protein